jgi:preprotein translocase subunit SecA
MTSLAPLTGFIHAVCSPAARRRLRDQELVATIRRHAAALHSESDQGLATRSESLRDATQRGTDPTGLDVLIPGFALVCAAARRTIGIEYYDVQIQAGLALTRGTIAEMATGEGKTFVAAFPAFLHALAGRGVHVMTVNGYLAERDHALLSPLFERLGMSAGLLRSNAEPAEKRWAYDCDITYGPGYEFGFDYLRDQVARMNVPKPRLGDSFRSLVSDRPVPLPAAAQRGHAFAIVDEADSVMIDEATTPMILAGCAAAATRNPAVYVEARRTADSLAADRDYVVDRTAKWVRFTAAGAANAAARVNAQAISGLERPWLSYVERALYAAIFLDRDVDYIVSDGRVMLVDSFTGRIFADRTLSVGLHQAVECQEGLTITAETQSIAHISRQRFFRLYRALCGMTGTAAGSEAELREVYERPVVHIATRLPVRRIELPTRYFAAGQSKWDDVVAEVERLHHAQRPILVGTRTIAASELLARQLLARHLPFQLLNGRQDEEEARIVARAGQAGSITIATNMAGRGTDIKLAPGVAELGGLHVIGTERHESARVDRQLAGRAARQGDPGSCQFFVSADDGLIRRFGPRLAETMNQLSGETGEVAEDLSSQVAAIQLEAERHARERRHQLFAHDHWEQDVLARLTSEGPS